MKKSLLVLVCFVHAFAFAQQQPHTGGGVILEDLSTIEWIRKVQPSHSLHKTLDLPAAVDNSAHIPPVLNQGGTNACLSFAMGYYYKTYEGWQINGWDVTDPAHQYSPTFMYNLVNGGGNNGTFASDAGKVLMDHGIATLADCPFTEGDILTWPTTAQFTSALQNKWSAMYTINTANDAGVDQLKAHIAAGNVAVQVINIWGNFTPIGTYGNNYAVANKRDGNSGPHAVTIVGYDDTHATDDGPGAFRCVNSWGTFWGDGGYFWMSYAAVKDADLSAQYAVYGTPKIGYTPTITAEVKFTHPSRRSIEVSVGGGTYDPLSFLRKDFLHFQNNSHVVSHAMPAHNIVLDLTDIGFQFKTYTSTNFFFVACDVNDFDTQSGSVDYLKVSAPGFITEVTAPGVPLAIADNFNDPRIINLTVNNISGNSLVLTSPAASAGAIRRNAENTLTWTSSGVANVKLEYSTDDGINWTSIANSVAAATGSYAWNVPNFLGSSMLVRISDVAKPWFADLNTASVWAPEATTAAYGVGGGNLTFSQGKVSASFASGGDYTITYYPHESPIHGDLPPGINSVATFYWTLSTTTPFTFGEIYLTKSALQAGLIFTKTSILARSAPGDAWIDLGQSNANATQIVTDWTIDGTTAEFTLGSTDPANPLPVELVSFEARPEAGSVLLLWKTATEINSHGFEVQRAATQSGHRSAQWETLGYVAASGTSSAPKNYTYTDTRINSLKYLYRLKIIDNDGAFDYSAVVEALSAIPTAYTLSQNYPNPFNPSTKIDYTLPASGRVRLDVYSVTGQLVASLVDAEQEAGYYAVSFDAAQRASGLYYYRMTVNGRSIVKKMILMK